MMKKEVLKAKLVEMKDDLTPELEQELYNSDTYKMSEDEIFNLEIEEIENSIKNIDSTDSLYKGILDAIDESIEDIKVIKDLEIEIFGIDKDIQDFFDRSLRATERVAEFYSNKYVAIARG